MARKVPSHQEIHCLHSVVGFRLKPLFASVDMSKQNRDESVIKRVLVLDDDDDGLVLYLPFNII